MMAPEGPEDMPGVAEALALTGGWRAIAADTGAGSGGAPTDGGGDPGAVALDGAGGAATAPAGGERRPGTAFPSVDRDPLYAEALVLVQRGQWAQAEEALGELQLRYPASIEVRYIQHELALHLSAERTWGERAPKRRKPVARRSRTVRLLVVANVALYLLLAVVWLLSRVGGL